MGGQGFIKLHRQMLSWGWYTDPITKALFIHLLLIASWKDSEWKGMIVKRGQCITGRKQLANVLGCSERQIRTAIAHLISTSEVTIKTTNKFSVITIEKYDDYQGLLIESDQQNDQQNDQQSTTSKEYKVVNNIIGDFFESIWKLYPIKKGKDRIKPSHKKQLYSIGYDKMAPCIERYVRQTDPTYLMHGGRFFSSGYLDYMIDEKPKQKFEKVIIEVFDRKEIK